MSLNVFLIISIVLTIVVWIISFIKESNPKKTTIWCFLGLTVITILSYWCFTHYSHSKNDKYYRNTDSYALELKGIEFSEGKSLSLFSEDGRESLWDSNKGYGDLVLESGSDGCYLNSRNLEVPLCISDKENHKLFHVVNLTPGLTLNDGDELAIKDLRKAADLSTYTLKYEKFYKKREGLRNIFKKKKQGFRFIFKSEPNRTDTIVRNSFEKGMNMYELLADEIGIGLPREILGECDLLREHFTIDRAKNSEPDPSVHLFCKSWIRNMDALDSIQFFINGQRIKIEQGNFRHPVDSCLFYSGITPPLHDFWLVQRDSGKVSINYRNSLRYYFPKDTVCGEKTIFLTTDMQEIVDRQDGASYFYRIMPGQPNRSPYAAKANLHYYCDKADVNASPEYTDLTLPIIQSIPTGISEDFLLHSSAKHNPSSQLADISYRMRIHDYRTENVAYQKTQKHYIFLLTALALLFLIILKNAPENDSLYSRKTFLETSVYVVLLSFLTARLIMLWRLFSFPPIENSSSYELGQILNTNNYNWTWIAIYGFLFVRILFEVPRVRSLWNGFKNKFENFFRRLIKVNRTPTFKELLFLILILSVGAGILYLVLFFLGTIPRLTFIKTSATIVVFCWATSILLSIDSPLRKGQQIVLISANCLLFLFFLVILNFEAGLAVPLAGFIGLAFLIVSFRTIEVKPKTALISLAVIAIFISFFHLTIAKQLTPAIGKVSHRVETRMQAMVHTPSELFTDPNVTFKGKDNYMQEILNATSNYWFIGNHLEYRKTIKKEHPKFQPMQEYSQKGVSYMTQTRDLSILRYLNFEHGQGPVACLCLLLILQFFIVASHTKPWDRKTNLAAWLPMLTALFLLTYSLYLALANNNSLIFVGLDFPFLTLTSSSAPVSFIIFLLAILYPICSKKDLDQALSSSSSNIEKSSIVRTSLFSLIILLMATVPMLIRNIKAVKTTPKFLVSMEPLVDFIRHDLNPKLDEYQQMNEVLFKTSDRGTVEKLVAGEVDKLLKQDNIFSGLKDTASCVYRAGDTAFIRSVFRKATTYSDPRYLIYLKKTNGKYTFAANRNFNYLGVIFNGQKDDEWHGDLLAASAKETHKPIVNGKVLYDIDIDKLSSLDAESLKGTLLGNKYLYNLPARYSYDGQNKIIYIREDNNNSGILIPQGDPSKKIRMIYSCQIYPKDTLKVDNKTIQLGMSQEHYLARNIHFNGRSQIIYPLGEDFVFAANFYNMLTNYYKAYNMESNPRGYTSSDADVRISLDYELLTDVLQYCKNYKKNVTQQGTGLTVAAVDGNGCVRLLADYNPRPIHRNIDPNNPEKMEEIMTNSLLNGERLAEREALQNRNIRMLNAGPGSTIKPVLFAAIASQTNLDWPNFTIHGSESKIDPGAYWHHFGEYDFLKYKINPELRKEPSSERFGNEMHVDKFIATSNNFFFGSILMLGTAYNNHQNALMETSGDDGSFPRYKIHEKWYKFRGKFIPELFKDRKSLRESALESGLDANFNYRCLGDVYDQKDTSAAKAVQKNMYMMKLADAWGIKTPNEYVFPETPNFLRNDYAEKEAGHSLVDIFNQFLNIVKGGNPVRTSPLAMAEAYLRIAQGNSAPNLLTYSERDTAAAKERFYCPGYVDDNAYWNAMRTTLFQGLWDVIDKGTLKGLRSYQQTLLNEKHIYLYGKTGTCNDNKNHHYALILTNQKLNGTDPIDRNTLKIYVVFFGYYDAPSNGHGKTPPVTEAIVEKIINSETFKQYWYAK